MAVQKLSKVVEEKHANFGSRSSGVSGLLLLLRTGVIFQLQVCGRLDVFYLFRISVLALDALELCNIECTKMKVTSIHFKKRLQKENQFAKTSPKLWRVSRLEHHNGINRSHKETRHHVANPA